MDADRRSEGDAHEDPDLDPVDHRRRRYARSARHPKADAMLHLVIADIGAGTDAMAGKDANSRPALGLVKVAQAVNQYGSHFDHPGFKPIRNVH